MPMDSITQLASAWTQGEPETGDELFSMIYHELRRISATANQSVERSCDHSAY